MVRAAKLLVMGPGRSSSRRRRLLLGLALTGLALGAVLLRVAAHRHLAKHRRRAGVRPVVLAYDRFLQTCRGSEFGRPRRHWFVEGLGGAQRALPELRFYLRLSPSQADARDAAVFLLATCGRDALPMLLEVLAGSDPAVRAAAAEGLGLVDAPAAEVLPALRAALADDESRVRCGAARGLCLLEADALPALDELRSRASDPDRRVRHWAVRAIERIGPRRSEALPELKRLLGDDCPDVRRAAARTLGEIGPGAREAIPALKLLLKDLDVPVRSAAREALRKIGQRAKGRRLKAEG